MPLPDNWEGIFLNSDSGGNWLFDLTPSEFINRVVELNPPDPQTIVARACIDLYFNGYHEKLEEMLDSASAKWEDMPWEQVHGISITIAQMINLGLDIDEEDIYRIAFNAITILFEGQQFIQVVVPEC